MIAQSLSGHCRPAQALELDVVEELPAKIVDDTAPNAELSFRRP